MIERAVHFGPADSLIGVLTEPAPERRVAGAPAVLLWNVGLNHRVGPFRAYVDLARRLAEQGFASLRFDASGLGDSEPRRDAATERERAWLDLRDAMALCEMRLGIREVVLVGFCSSVDAAHQVALRDPRVAGVVYFEGYAWRTPGFWLRYPKRFLSPARWERLARHYLPGIFPTAGGPPGGEREQVFLREYPTPAQLRSDARALITRGAKLLFVHVGNDTDYGYRDQIFAMLGNDLRGKIDVEFYPEADHTFFRPEDRRRAIEKVSSWMATRFAARASAPALIPLCETICAPSDTPPPLRTSASHGLPTGQPESVQHPIA